MSKNPTALLSDFGGRLQALSLNQKILLGTLVIGMLLSTVFIFQKTNDDYDILYDNMSLPDAAAAVEKLQSMNEPYRVVNGGHTILVPRVKKNDLVLATANELTSDETVNLSKIPPVLQGDIQKEWIKKLNTQEIETVLSSIHGIKKARVIVSQPEYNVFSEDSEAVTASVMLVVNPGFRLHSDRIKVIKNLVAHAVPGLAAENVAIADNSGNPLSDATGSGASSNSEAFRRQKLFEESVTRKVLAILVPVVGKENTVVSVSATMNFDQAQSDIKRVIPTVSSSGDSRALGLPISEQIDTEEYNGAPETKPDSPVGEPGVKSNSTPKYQGSSTEKNGKNNYRHTKSTTNFTTSSEHKKVVYASGFVERMTVAVVLNKVLTSKETQEIKQLVESAAGINTARGDLVEIKGFQFSEPLKNNEKELVEAAETAQTQNFYLQLASVIAMSILSFVALFIFYMLFKKPSASKYAEGEAIADEYGNYIQESSSGTMALASGEEDPVFEALDTRMDPEIEHMKASISTLVEDDPEEAARVIMTYMKDV
ncbi:MAG: flagellar basal-body MS-ring/collar protein FliF [Cyanobacteria bacterium P01_H01_bin.74]